MAKTVKRGYVESDFTEFSEDSIKIIKKVQSDVYLLINRGYEIDKAVEFTGNHYLLSARQRLSIKRSTSPEKSIDMRVKKLINNACEGLTLSIDGLNLIITLEVALSKSTLIKCMDGTTRDLAGLRGTYRLIDKTDEAIRLIAEKFKSMKIKKAVFYLDSPVSNTGRLKERIFEIMPAYGFETEVNLVPNADVVLNKLDNVITTDAIILNDCISWLNTATEIIEENSIAKAIDLSVAE